MKVFISWSGPQSHAVALLLRDWLPTVIQQARPWVSSEDISKGAAWLAAIDTELQTTSRGIVCVTPGNESAPWLNFEAGALAKEAGQQRVCVALLDIEPANLVGPLRNFQATRLVERSDVKKLMQTLNDDLPIESRLDAHLLEHSFNREWPSLLDALGKLGVDPGADAGAVIRSERDLLEEVLVLVRSIARANATTPSNPARANPADYTVGNRVMHDTFGLGRIIAIDTGTKETELVLTIDFDTAGKKRILARYAPLEVL